MSAEKILSGWKKKQFSPVYWFEGEEEYYIDQLMDYAEHHILPESEASFNLSVFYGRDADWSALLNACRRYPMFAEKQVVLLKEAQHMKDIDKLESYIASPLESTIFIVGYKGKALDKRSKLAKLIQSKSVYFLSAKIRDGKIQEWIHELIHSKGLEIKTKAAALLEEHIGNDLSRIANEIDKLSLNLNGKKDIDEDDIEKFIGISKEYNVFELQAAISRKDAVQALRIIQYFESNPKAVPIQMALPALYANFSKIYSVFGMPDKSDTALKPVFYFNASALAQAKETMKRYGYPGIERILLLLHEYNLRSIGIGHGADSGPALMREMVVKMMM